MPAIEHLVHANKAYTATFPGARPVRPKLGLAVVTCMDSRLDLFGALGLDIGDAHLLRNAGGVITDDILRSLAISQRKLGTREIVLIHHTNCGMDDFDDDAFRAELEDETGERPLAERARCTIGGLLNVSFGNTAELILALFVLPKTHARIAQAQITGSTLLFLGISALVGGGGRVRQMRT